MDQKQQIVDRVKQANNILVTVSNDPSVDQLAACIGLTLIFNKMGKHATAVFSGTVPSTLEFLQPEKTIETTTDSLRDFIISLDKAKADKLRYKVEDKVVKIFITPYRTSISEHDLEFGQGDFNVDIVIALGVHDQGQLDQAITSHGRILHDATVATVNVKPGGEFGSLNWLVPGASSLCELATDLVNALDKQLVDSQVATALLTGIVAETKRFSNERTSPDTMSISAQLMAAGANQQLVATKLEPPAPPPAPEPPKEEPAPPAEVSKADDGTLEISHAEEPKEEEKPAEEEKPGEEKPAEEQPEEEQPEEEKPDDDEDKPVSSLDDLSGDENGKEAEKKPLVTPRIQIDEHGSLKNLGDKEEKPEEKHDEAATIDPTGHLGSSHSRVMLQPPSSTQGAPDPNAMPGMPGSEFGASPDDEERPSSAPPPSPFMPSSMMPGPPPPPPAPTDLASPPAVEPPAVEQPPAEPPAVMAPPEPESAPAPPPALDLPSLAPPSPTDSTPPSLTPPLELTPPTPVQTPAENPAEPHAFAMPPATAEAPVDDLASVTHSSAPDFSAAPPAGTLEPIKALNAQPLGDPLHGFGVPASGGLPPDLTSPVAGEPPSAPALNIPSPVGAPPPGPPPMVPPMPQ